MALAYASWVSETGTLTGTDPTYTLPNTASPASGNQFLRTLGAAFTAASDVILTISNSTGAETSIWTFTPGASGAAGTIERVQLIESSTGATINWAGQTVTIGLEIPAPASVSAGAASAGLIPFLGSTGVLDSSVIGAPPYFSANIPPSGSASASFNLAQNSFVTVPLNTLVADTANGWNSSTYTYTFEEAGKYLIITKLRPVDNDSVGNYGQGAFFTGDAQGDANFSWFNTNQGASTNRNGSINARIVSAAVGDTVYMYAYINYTSNGQDGAAMDIVRLG